MQNKSSRQVEIFLTWIPPLLVTVAFDRDLHTFGVFLISIRKVTWRSSHWTTFSGWENLFELQFPLRWPRLLQDVCQKMSRLGHDSVNLPDVVAVLTSIFYPSATVDAWRLFRTRYLIWSIPPVRTRSHCKISLTASVQVRDCKFDNISFSSMFLILATVISILTDVNGFWKYDNRELLMNDQDDN